MSIKHLPEIPMGHAQWWRLIHVGYNFFCDFRPISRYILQTTQDTAIVTIEAE